MVSSLAELNGALQVLSLCLSHAPVVNGAGAGAMGMDIISQRNLHAMQI